MAFRGKKGDNAYVNKGPDKNEILEVKEVGKGPWNDHVKLSNGQWYHRDMLGNTGMPTTK